MMESWNKVTLGSIADFRNGVNFNKESFGSGIKVINVKDFQDYFSPRFDELSEINPDGVVPNASLLHENDVVFVRSNGNRELIGRSLFVANEPFEPITHSAFTIRVRFNSDLAFPGFYAYLFRSSLIRNVLSSYGGGTNISNLNQGILSELEVPLPPLPIQRRIAAILFAYDDLIENNTRRIQALEQAAHDLYREWFVEFRFPGHESVPLVDSGTDYGMIPQGWGVVKLEEVLEHHIGGGWGKDEPDEKHTLPAYVIRGTDIPDARYVNVDDCPLRFHTESNLRTRRLQVGDVVFEVSGGSKGQPVGRALWIGDYLLRTFSEDVICASFCKLLRTSQMIDSLIFYLYLLDIYQTGEIEKYQVQSTGIINFKFAYFLEGAFVLIPTDDIQTTFSEFVQPMFDEIQILGKRNSALREARDLLLPRLVSGQVDVGAVDIFIEEN